MNWRYEYRLKSFYFFAWAAWATFWLLLVLLTETEHPIRTVFFVGFFIPWVLYIVARRIVIRWIDRPDE